MTKSGDVRDRHLVQAVGQRRVEHLGPGEAALAEVLTGTHLGNQLLGDGLACVVGGERAQHVGVPGPLLEQLRGSLDEVPLGCHTREPGPLVTPCEQVVDQMPELVEERHDVGVLHQPASEVAHQHALGQLPIADTRDEVELRGVLVLALAGVQVEIDPAQRRPFELDVIDGNVLVPRHAHPAPGCSSARRACR